jgi:hypothetical protein
MPVFMPSPLVGLYMCAGYAARVIVQERGCWPLDLREAEGCSSCREPTTPVVPPRVEKDLTAAGQILIVPLARGELATAHVVTETQDGAGPFYRHRGLRDAIV